MSILDFIKDVTKEATSFENHPVKQLPLEEKVLYLRGLALIMNADGAISDEEIEYLRILINSFELDEELLGTCIEFSKSPDRDTGLAFFRTFQRNAMAKIFLFDAWMMAYRDNDIGDKEKAVVNTIGEQLEVLKGTQEDIYTLFCCIVNNRWQEIAVSFSSHRLNPEHFKHLLNYYNVDLQALLKTTDKSRATCIQSIVRSAIADTELEFGKLSYDSIEAQSKEVTKAPVSFQLPYSVVVPFLQSLIDRDELIIRDDEAYFSGDDKPVLKLSKLNLTFDKLHRTLLLTASTDENTRITWPNRIVLRLLDVDEKLSSQWQIQLIAHKFYGMAPCYSQLKGHQIESIMVDGERVDSWTLVEGNVCRSSIIDSLVVPSDFGQSFMWAVRDEDTQKKHQKEIRLKRNNAAKELLLQNIVLLDELLEKGIHLCR